MGDRTQQQQRHGMVRTADADRAVLVEHLKGVGIEPFLISPNCEASSLNTRVSGPGKRTGRAYLSAARPGNIPVIFLHLTDVQRGSVCSRPGL